MGILLILTYNITVKVRDNQRMRSTSKSSEAIADRQTEKNNQIIDA